MKRSLKLNVLICTIDRNISNLHKILLSYRKDVTYIVSHQYRDKEFKEIPAELIREDVFISQIQGGGLSRNRNNALKLADGDIALIADDDIKYLPDAFTMIREVFENDSLLDVACFKIKTLAGEPEYKNYPANSYSLTRKGKKHSISSVELAFRISSIKKHGIQFDERFGLGSEKIFFGEESVFINDCIRNNLVVKYLPEYIVEHSYMSSTKDGQFDNNYKSFCAGARDFRENGLKALFSAIFTTIRITPRKILLGKTPWPFLNYRLKGIFYIYRTNKSKQK